MFIIYIFSLQDVFYTTDEELEDYVTSVYASIGAMEQLLVSTSVKLMISEEETSTLNEVTNNDT